MTDKEAKWYKTSAICWTCKWAAGKDYKCPWATRSKPVPGWEAEEGIYSISDKEYRRTATTYKVKKCPLYTPLDELGQLQPDKPTKEELRAIKKAETEAKRKAELDLIEKLWLEDHLSYEQISIKTRFSTNKISRLIKILKDQNKSRSKK